MSGRGRVEKNNYVIGDKSKKKKNNNKGENIRQLRRPKELSAKELTIAVRSLVSP